MHGCVGSPFAAGSAVNRIKNALKFIGIPLLWILVLMIVVAFLAHGYPLVWLRPTDTEVQVHEVANVTFPSESGLKNTFSVFSVFDEGEAESGHAYLLADCSDSSSIMLYGDGERQWMTDDFVGGPPLAVNTPWGVLFSRFGSSLVGEVVVGDEEMQFYTHRIEGEVTGLYNTGAGAAVVSTELHNQDGTLSDFPHGELIVEMAKGSDEPMQVPSSTRRQEHAAPLFTEHIAIHTEPGMQNAKMSLDEAWIMNSDGHFNLHNHQHSQWVAAAFHIEDVVDSPVTTELPIRLYLMAQDSPQQWESVEVDLERLPINVSISALGAESENERVFADLYWPMILYTDRQLIAKGEKGKVLWKFDPPSGGTVSNVVMASDTQAVVSCGKTLYFVDEKGEIKSKLTYFSEIKDIRAFAEDNEVMMVITDRQLLITNFSAELLWSVQFDSSPQAWEISATQDSEHQVLISVATSRRLRQYAVNLKED